MTIAANAPKIYELGVRACLLTEAGLNFLCGSSQQDRSIVQQDSPSNTQGEVVPMVFEHGSGAYSRFWKSWKDSLDRALVLANQQVTTRTSNFSQSTNVRVRLIVDKSCVVLGAEVVDVLSEFNDVPFSLLSAAGVFGYAVDFLCGDEGQIYCDSPLGNIPRLLRETARCLEGQYHTPHVTFASKTPTMLIDQRNDKYLRELFSNMFRGARMTIDVSEVWPFMSAFLEKTKNGHRDAILPTPPKLPKVWLALDHAGVIVGHTLDMGLKKLEKAVYERGISTGATFVRVCFQQYLPLAFPIKGQHTRVWDIEGDNLNDKQSVAMKHLLMRYNLKPPQCPEGWVVSAISDGRIVA